MGATCLLLLLLVQTLPSMSGTHVRGPSWAGADLRLTGSLAGPLLLGGEAPGCREGCWEERAEGPAGSGLLGEGLPPPSGGLVPSSMGRGTATDKWGYASVPPKPRAPGVWL